MDRADENPPFAEGGAANTNVDVDGVDNVIGRFFLKGQAKS